MAYLPFSLQDQRNRQPTLQQALAQGTGSTAPLGAAGGGSSAGQVGPQPTQAPGQGSGFVNLSDYLGANQGGAQQMARTFYGGVEGSAGSSPGLGETSPAQGQIDAWNANASQWRDTINSSPEAVMSANDAYGGRTSGMKGLDSYLLGTAGVSQKWDAMKAATPNYPPLTAASFTPTPYIGAGSPGTDPNNPPQVAPPTGTTPGSQPTFGEDNPWFPKKKQDEEGQP